MPICVPNQRRGKLTPVKARACRLTTQPNADSREWTIEADIFFLGRIDATVHGAPEEVRAVACTHLEVLQTESQSRKATEIGHGDGARARRRIDSVMGFDIALRVYRGWVVLGGHLIVHARLLPTE